MPTVVGVHLRNTVKRQYFCPGSLELQVGDAVLVPTQQGRDLGYVCQNATCITQDQLPENLRTIIRIATPEDHQQLAANSEKEEQAFHIIKEKIAFHRLDMKLVSVEYAFDNSKLTANFTSNGRVDFRALVKDLASTFRMRIELKQIGVRDEARIIGGIGSCGKELCCVGHLTEFAPVSIRMAKEQSLSLNPTKISGVCGRLMCCLKYEQEQYEKSRKRLPKLGKEVMTPRGKGIVAQVNTLLETVSVRIQNQENSEVLQFSADQVQRLSASQNQRNGQKIPKSTPLPEMVADIDEEFMGTDMDLICNEIQIWDED
jgi:cell fate regulator YaaT (PSP1 superfamily)